MLDLSFHYIAPQLFSGDGSRTYQTYLLTEQRRNPITRLS